MRQIILIAILIIGIFNGNGVLNGQASGKNGNGDPVKEDSLLQLTLKQAQTMAIKYNATVENSRLDIRMAKKKIWETTTTGLPRITGKITYRNNLTLPTTLIPAEIFDPDAEPGTFLGVKFGTKHNAAMELNVDQLIFSGSYIVALQASKVYLRLSEESLVKSEIDIREMVANTYYLVLLAENSKETLTANLENVKKTLYETNELFKAGFLEETDADQIQLTVTDLENSIKSTERQIKVAYNLLKFQMGMDLQRKVRVSESLKGMLEQVDDRSLLTDGFILDNHIDFRMADTQEKSMKLLLKREQSEYLPTISAFFNYSRSTFRNSFNFFKKSEDQWFPATTLGLNINIPIFNSGERGAKVAQARMDLRKARNTKKQVKDKLQLELMQARNTFADALDTLESRKKNVTLAKRIYDRTSEKYTKGTATSLDLTQAHGQYLNAESAYIQAAVELLQAKTKLDKALNRL